MESHAIATEALEWLRSQPPWLAAGAIGVTAGLEYVVPPVPGDTVAVAGGVLVARDILPASLVLAVVTLGSVLGALGAYCIGALATTRPALRRLLARFVTESAFQRASATYQRWGRLLILLNRFFPGVRTSFLFAAGLFGLPLRDVAILATISAVLWNSMLIAAGFILGANLEAVLRFITHYSTYAWTALILIVGVAAVRFALHALRRKR